MKVFNNSFSVLEKGLDSLANNHKAISNNISNVDTPGYKRKYVSFKDELSKVVKDKNDLVITDSKHISTNAKDVNSFNAKVRTEEGTSVRNDNNNVSIDAEMAILAQNTLEYQTIIKQITNQFKRLDSVIQKGGR